MGHSAKFPIATVDVLFAQYLQRYVSIYLWSKRIYFPIGTMFVLSVSVVGRLMIIAIMMVSSASHRILSSLFLFLARFR